MALQLMPDHLHGVLFVKEKMEKPLGMALRGFKQSCNRHYHELVIGVQSVALSTQHLVTVLASHLVDVAHSLGVEHFHGAEGDGTATRALLYHDVNLLVGDFAA